MSSRLGKTTRRCFLQIQMICCLWMQNKEKSLTIKRRKIYLIVWAVIVGLWSSYKILDNGLFRVIWQNYPRVSEKSQSDRIEANSTP